MSYVQITTSAEVWAVIKARHGNDLSVFESFSDPDGTFNGGPGEIGELYAEKAAEAIRALLPKEE